MFNFLMTTYIGGREKTRERVTERNWGTDREDEKLFKGQSLYFHKKVGKIRRASS